MMIARLKIHARCRHLDRVHAEYLNYGIIRTCTYNVNLQFFYGRSCQKAYYALLLEHNLLVKCMTLWGERERVMS